MAKKKPALTKEILEKVDGDKKSLWTAQHGRLKRKKGHPGKTEHLFRVVGEKIPYTALASVKAQATDVDAPNRARLEQLNIALNDGQEIVEVVRHAAGEAADRIHFQRMLKLLLGAFLFGDVDMGDHRAAAAVLRERRNEGVKPALFLF